MTKFKYIFLFLIYFVFSYYILDLYQYGDQVHYRRFYSDISEVSFFEAFALGYFYLASIEPLTIFMLWIGSSLEIPKDIYISFFNAGLAVSLIKLCEKYKVKWYVILLLLSNFYLLVLFTGAERLKFAYLILIISLLSNKKYINNLIYLSPLAHLQSTLLIAPKMILSFYQNNFRKKSSLFRNVLSIIFFIILFYFFYFLKDAILRKFYSYYTSSWDISEIFQLSVLLLVYLIITKNYKHSFLIFVPLFFLAMIIGNDRVNMMGFTFITFLLMRANKLNHPLYIALLFYFVYKAYFLLFNIINYGEGWV